MKAFCLVVWMASCLVSDWAALMVFFEGFIEGFLDGFLRGELMDTG